jgi:hypothetical protein
MTPFPSQMTAIFARSISLLLFATSAIAGPDFLWTPTDNGNRTEGYYDWDDEDHWNPDGFPGSNDEASFTNIYRNLNGNFTRVTVQRISLNGNRTVKHVDFSFSRDAYDYSMELGVSGSTDTLTLSGGSLASGIPINRIISLTKGLNFKNNYSSTIFSNLNWTVPNAAIATGDDKGTLSLYGSLTSTKNAFFPVEGSLKFTEITRPIRGN